MAGSRVAHPTLTGPSVVKEIILGIVFGFAAGGIWKKMHWDQQKKTKLFYEALNRGDVTVVAEE